MRMSFLRISIRCFYLFLSNMFQFFARYSSVMIYVILLEYDIPFLVLIGSISSNKGEQRHMDHIELSINVYFPLSKSKLLNSNNPNRSDSPSRTQLVDYSSAIHIETPILPNLNNKFKQFVFISIKHSKISTSIDYCDIS